MNLVYISGRLVKDPELKEAQNGTVFLGNAIAVNRDKDTADFIDIVAFDKTATLINQYFSKGDRIGVRGKLQKRSYQNNNGQNVYVTEVIVNEVDFLQNKKTEGQQEETTKQEPKQERGWSYGKDEFGEDLPF